jgi:hypothetical protein
MEGLDMFKVYLKYFGFDSFKNKNSKDYFRYGEFHNDISRDVRKETIKLEIEEENKNGKLLKIVMFSPAGSEGISLENVIQVHITEPYWHEVRITQMIGRAIRQCSHKNLPINERHVDIYRYKTVKNNVKVEEIIDGQTVTKRNIIIEDENLLKTIDWEIDSLAQNKNNLLASFMNAIKEIAIDCELFKNHNMIDKPYKCFKFNEVSLFDKNIGPAYKEDEKEDSKILNGSNSNKTITVKVRAMKIHGVIVEGVFDEMGSLTMDKNVVDSVVENYWCNMETGTVYDYDLHYPIGKIKYTDSGVPDKLDKDTYKIELIDIGKI